MNRLLLYLWLIGILTFWPASGWAAPSSQEGTVPSPTPEPVTLVTEELYTIPEDLVNGDVFDLAVVLRNTSAFWINDLAVTIQDVADDRALIPVNGKETEFLSSPGPNQAIGLTKGLSYRTGISGLRQINLHIEYTYMLNDQTILRTQTETLTVRVLEPTPTPTSTLTPTSTATPTVTPTPTLTPLPTVNLAATLELVQERQDELAASQAAIPPPDLTATEAVQALAINEAVAAALTEAATIVPTVSPTATSTDIPASQGLAPGEVDLPELSNAVVVEFEAVPAPLNPGQLFTMILIVRNNSSVDLAEIVVEWDRDGSDPAIAPSGGGTRWFIGALTAGASSTLIRRFYVAEEATPGIKRGRVLVTYRWGNLGRGNDAEVNLLVEQNDPVWLRFLRALFGSLIP